MLRTAPSCVCHECGCCAVHSRCDRQCSCDSPVTSRYPQHFLTVIRPSCVKVMCLRWIFHAHSVCGRKMNGCAAVTIVKKRYYKQLSGVRVRCGSLKEKSRYNERLDSRTPNRTIHYKVFWFSSTTSAWYLFPVNWFMLFWRIWICRVRRFNHLHANGKNQQNRTFHTFTWSV